jgi:hypothetical protein
MNIFRIPLNAFVVLLLLKIGDLGELAVFQICMAMHGIALACYSYFFFSSSVVNPDKGEETETFM